MDIKSLTHLKVDRWLAGNGKKQFIIPVLGMLGSVLLVALSWFVVNKGHLLLSGIKSKEEYIPGNVFDAAYFFLFGNGGQSLFPGNHLVGLLITTLGLVVLAVMTSAITNYFDKRAQGYLCGETAYRLKDHIVILGASDIAYSIISQIGKKAGNEGVYFLIQTGKDVEKTRREFYSFLEKGIDDDKILFIFGDRTSLDDLDRLCLSDAKEVFVIGDAGESDSVESYRDAYNMDCLNHIAEKVSKNTSRDLLPCHVLFEYQTTFSAFQFTDLLSDIKGKIDFRPFNFYDMWAQKVLVKGKDSFKSETDGFKFKPLYTVSDEKLGDTYINYDSDKSVHLIIVGMSKMGVSMAVQAAHLCHFPNFVRDRSKKTRITFIDANAAVEKDFFMGRFKEMMRLSATRFVDVKNGPFDDDSGWKVPADDWVDIEWEFINGRVEQPEIQEYIEHAAADADRIVTIAVCLTKSHQAIAAALYFPESVYENCLQILVYQRLSGYIVHNIACPDTPRNGISRYRKMRPFGMIEDGFDQDLDNDAAARMVGYAYGHDQDPHFEKYDEKSYKMGEWQTKIRVSDRWSSQFFANSIDVKLRSVGSSREEDGAEIGRKLEEGMTYLKRVEHNRWCVEKLMTGFRPINDDEEREIRSMPENERKSKNDEWKKWPTMAHLDLRSYEGVVDIDPVTARRDNDSRLIRAIPYIVARK